MLDSIFPYNDWANGQLLRAAGALSDAQLDQVFDIGPGSLRKTLQHVHNGEFVWLRRWRGEAQTPWPPESNPMSLSAIAESVREVQQQRNAFLKRLGDSDLNKTIAYRDSKGSMFNATLRDMILQMFIHSTHHRAQAVNIFRRLGAGLVELDYMMSVRKPIA